MESIAQRAGIGPALFYNHFAGKHLAAAVWRALYDQLEEHETGLPGDTPFNTPAAVAAHLNALSRLAIAQRPLTVALIQAMNDETARPEPDSQIQSVRDQVPLPGLLIQLLLAGQGAGQLDRDVDAMDIGVFIVSGTVLRILNPALKDPAVLGSLISTLALSPFGMSDRDESAGYEGRSRPRA